MFSLRTWTLIIAALVLISAACTSRDTPVWTPTPSPEPQVTTPAPSPEPTVTPNPDPFEPFMEQVQELIDKTPTPGEHAAVTENPCTQQHGSFDAIFTIKPPIREGQPTFMVLRYDDGAHHQTMYNEDRSLRSEVIILDQGWYFRVMGDDHRWGPWKQSELMPDPPLSTDVWSPFDNPKPELTFCGIWRLSDVQDLGPTTIGSLVQYLGPTTIGPEDTPVTHYLVEFSGLSEDDQRFEYFIDDSGTMLATKMGALKDDVWHHMTIVFFTGFGEPNVITAPDLTENVPTPTPAPTPTPEPTPNPDPFEAFMEQVQELIDKTPTPGEHAAVTEDACRTGEVGSFDAIFTFMPPTRGFEMPFVVLLYDDGAHHQIMYHDARTPIVEVIILDQGWYLRLMGNDDRWGSWAQAPLLSDPPLTFDVWSPFDNPKPELPFCGLWPLSDVQDLGPTTIGTDNTPVTHYLVELSDFSGYDKRFEYFIDASGTMLATKVETFKEGVLHQMIIVIFSGFGEPNVITAPVIPQE